MHTHHHSVQFMCQHVLLSVSIVYIRMHPHIPHSVVLCPSRNLNNIRSIKHTA